MGKYDITSKYLVETYPRDWLALAGTIAENTRVVDSDLGTIARVADKVIEVDHGSAGRSILHVEAQTARDTDLDSRMSLYNALLRHRHKLTVRSVAVLLGRPADSPKIAGRILDNSDPEYEFVFRYRVIRVWQLSPDALLSGGVGTLPLAPIANVGPAELPALIERIDQRIRREITPPAAAEFWEATRVLLGLEYDDSFASLLLSGVRRMKESTTFMATLNEGRAEGRIEGERRIVIRLASERFGPPSASVAARLESVTDLAELEQLAVRILTVDDWNELLR